jgi:hypothetical protein
MNVFLTIQVNVQVEAREGAKVIKEVEVAILPAEEALLHKLHQEWQQ